jgi:hypothetical protein
MLELALDAWRLLIRPCLLLPMCRCHTLAMDPSWSSGFGVPGFVDLEEDYAMGFDFFSQLDSMPPPSNAAGIYI